MTIKQLIAELSAYDPELEVRVWCADTEQDNEITQATQGYTDGTLDTYVSIFHQTDNTRSLDGYDTYQSHDYPYDEYARARYVDQALNEWRERGLD